MRVGRILVCGLFACLWIPFAAQAGEPVVEDVVVTPSAAGGFNFSVTIRHADTGWDHYADRWVVLTPDGKTVLGERVLFHPHVDEQPFTRMLRAVVVPEQYSEVLVRAHDRKDGWGSKDFVVPLPGR